MILNEVKKLVKELGNEVAYSYMCGKDMFVELKSTENSENSEAVNAFIKKLADESGKTENDDYFLIGVSAVRVLYSKKRNTTVNTDRVNKINKELAALANIDHWNAEENKKHEHLCAELRDLTK